MNHLIAGLDKDGSGRLSAEELAEIVKTPKDLAAIVCFGVSPKSNATLPSIELHLGLRSWSACDNRPGNPEATLMADHQWLAWRLYENRQLDHEDRATTAALFQQFDKNHDQLLDRSETENAVEPLDLFEAIDLDGDDKIAPKELETVLDRRQLIENAKFHIDVTRPPIRFLPCWTPIMTVS